MKQQVVKNVLSNYFVSILGVVLGFLLVPFLILKLGTESYGLIALVDSTILFFEVVTVGVRTALARHATFSLAQGRKQEFFEILSTGRYVLFACAMLIGAAGCLISYVFPFIFKVPPDLFLQSRLLCFFVVVAFTISIPNIVFWSVLYARQRYDLINFSLSFGTLTRALAIFGLFSVLPKEHVNLTTYGLIYILFTWVQNFMIYRYQKQVMPELTIGVKFFRKGRVRDILSFSTYTSLHRLSGMLVGNMTNILLNMFYGPTANAVYSVATKFPVMLRRIFTEATWSLTPTFTDLAARNDRPRLEKLFFMYTKLLIIFTAPISLFLIVFSRQLIYLWVGPDFVVAGDLAMLYTAPLLLGIPFAVCGCINNAFGKIKVPSQVGIFYSVFNVVFGILLAKGFSMEIYGFALSNLLSAFAFLILFQPYYACRSSGVSLRRYLMGSVVRPFLPAGFFYGIAWLLAREQLSHPEMGIGTVLGIGSVLCLLSYAAGYAVGLKQEERSFVNGLLSSTLSRFKPSERTA